MLLSLGHDTVLFGRKLFFGVKIVRVSDYILSAETGIEVLLLVLAGELKILGFHRVYSCLTPLTPHFIPVRLTCITKAVRDLL